MNGSDEINIEYATSQYGIGTCVTQKREKQDKRDKCIRFQNHLSSVHLSRKNQPVEPYLRTGSSFGAYVSAPHFLCAHAT